MLNNIRIFVSDNVWRRILESLGAVIVSDKKISDIDFDSLISDMPMSPIELKSIILNAADKNRAVIIKSVFGKNVFLSDLQLRIVVMLYQTGGATTVELKSGLGFALDTTTHTIDTAIYELRKTFGRDFIKNNGGKYGL